MSPTRRAPRAGKPPANDPASDIDPANAAPRGDVTTADDPKRGPPPHATPGDLPPDPAPTEGVLQDLAVADGVSPEPTPDDDALRQQEIRSAVDRLPQSPGVFPAGWWRRGR